MPEVHGFKPDRDPKQYPPLVLAYIGDAVYEMYVRTRLLSEHPDMPAFKLHRLATQYVKAAAQSSSILAAESALSPEEEAVYHRGRNAKSHTVPKNADVGDYRRATGFEALAGWLYLSGKEDRLNEFMAEAFQNALKDV